MPLLTRRVASVMLFAAMLAAPALAAKPTASTKPQPKPLPPGVALVQVDDLHCKTCARKLAGKLYTVPGVVSVKADLKRDTATVVFQKKAKVSPTALWNAAVAANLKPLAIRVADKRLEAKDFPKAKTASTTPHGVTR